MSGRRVGVGGSSVWGKAGGTISGSAELGAMQRIIVGFSVPHTINHCVL